MNERLQVERFPLRWRPKHARHVHAGRITGYMVEWVESACGGVTPQHPENAGITDEAVDCTACLKRIARPLTLAQKHAFEREQTRLRLAGSGGAGATTVDDGEWRL